MPSARKGKKKAPAATEVLDQPSDVDAADTMATPSRGSRKRARGTDTTALASRNTRRKVKDTRALDREDTEGTEAHEHSDNETEPFTPTEQEIIQSLKVAEKPVNATEDFANELLEGQESVPGYGKIAGRDWVYIISQIEVNIGRPESLERLHNENGNGHEGTPTARAEVHIDLGPDRQISRLHATIRYEPESMEWIIMVNGRNGLRVDNNFCRRGSKTRLRNGSVIEIANTQMAFITTPTAGSEGPIWDASIIKQAQKSSEDEDDAEDDGRNVHGRAHIHSTARSHLQDPGVYQSDYQGQQQSSQQQHRSHPHSQRANVYPLPGTPMRTQANYVKSSPAANYARGVMMESTESIDYAADTAKDLKPPHSYAQLIGMAILSTPEQQMTLNNIYKWIMANYAFYRFNTGGWQNSIRHNLSLNKAFGKIARRTDEPGKGMKWMIEPAEFDNFVQQGMKGCRRPNPIPGTQSTLGSPNSPMGLRSGLKTDEDITPPLNTYHPAYPTTTEAYTPDRGPRNATNRHPNSSVGLGIEGNALADYDYPRRSTPRNGLNAIANAAGSPPALYVNDDARAGPLDTPFPLRASQRLAPPSTLRRPSDFIQFSSPAPFWKMDGLVGSTPFKPFDVSPLKTPSFPTLKKDKPVTSKDNEDDGESSSAEKDVEATVEKPRGDEESRRSPVINSSSPPRPHNTLDALEGSPTLSRPATAVAKSLTQLANLSKEQSNEHEKTPPATKETDAALVVQQQTPPTTVSQSSQPAPRHELPQTSVANSFESARPAGNGSFANNSYNGHVGHVGHVNGYHADDGDDEPIDLAKGFQPIGAFHQRNHLAMSMGMAGPQSYGR
ncbi:hypothetical protein DOTSEDRAFT_67520 [Dothistroma septosporum NZE10]|uniref:Fork-head domain-containing protein n=1 Tax=Dothistroma septosporum (strain NZE10 / CBS 128990) TaxID=675120 RepID=N1PZT3_DOTSN|nr:hypothetical protein DOTSEDRAFT_67520 [Dothistroma septosporum NZE10]